MQQNPNRNVPIKYQLGASSIIRYGDNEYSRIYNNLSDLAVKLITDAISHTDKHHKIESNGKTYVIIKGWDIKEIYQLSKILRDVIPINIDFIPPTSGHNV